VFDPGEGGFGGGGGKSASTSVANSARDAGFSAGGVIGFFAVPPVWRRVQAASPGHSQVFLQPQAVRYHRSWPSAPFFTPQFTFFHPSFTFASQLLDAFSMTFHGPQESLPHMVPYEPVRILLVSWLSKPNCSKKLVAVVP